MKQLQKFAMFKQVLKSGKGNTTMKDLQNKYSDGEGHFYFLLLFLMVIVIAVISFFAGMLIFYQWFPG